MELDDLSDVMEGKVSEEQWKKRKANLEKFEDNDTRFETDNSGHLIEEDEQELSDFDHNDGSSEGDLSSQYDSDNENESDSGNERNSIDLSDENKEDQYEDASDNSENDDIEANSGSEEEEDEEEDPKKQDLFTYRPAAGEDIYGRSTLSNESSNLSAKYVPPAKRKAATAALLEVDEVIVLYCM